MENFCDQQWLMIVPLFKEGEHLELDPNIDLPFVNFEGSVEVKKPKRGAYSGVYAVHVHPCHHEFWGSNYAKVGES